MSTINKKAFISKVLESLTSEQLTTLKGLVNGSTEPTFKSLINSTYGITSSDKGVKHIILETQRKTLSGYLIYNNTYCMMISYALNTQELSMFHILLNEQKVKAVSEYLDIDELRTLLDDSLIDGKVEALSSTGLKREVVEALPTGSAIQTNVIYLVPDITGESPNIYNEYMYIGDSWELIGSSATSGGSGIEVVELAGNSGTLSDSDYAKLLGNDAVVKIQNYILYKWYQDSSSIYYIQTNLNEQAMGQLTRDLKQLVIYSDKSWSYSASSKFVRANSGSGSSGILNTLNIGSYNQSYRVFPDIPADASTKTYALKLVNGTLTWVQE